MNWRRFHGTIELGRLKKGVKVCIEASYHESKDLTKKHVKNVKKKLPKVQAS